MKYSVIMDMDGVIYRGTQLVKGAEVFVEKLLSSGTQFLFLTNASERGPAELLKRMNGLGICGLTEEHFMTSSMVAAEYLKKNYPGARVYVLGGEGLRSEIENAKMILTNKDPEFVVVGLTKDFDYLLLSEAANHIRKGAHFLATNPDTVDPVEDGLIAPACGSILAAIEVASGVKPYVLGKPNALMMLYARKKLGSHSSETIMIGDRMDTDIIAGIESGMKTCLVLSGVSTVDIVKKFPYKPDYVFNNIGEIDLKAI